jgi:hypothetical protein
MNPGTDSASLVERSVMQLSEDSNPTPETSVAHQDEEGNYVVPDPEADEVALFEGIKGHVEPPSPSTPAFVADLRGSFDGCSTPLEDVQESDEDYIARDRGENDKSPKALSLDLKPDSVALYRPMSLSGGYPDLRGGSFEPRDYPTRRVRADKPPPDLEQSWNPRYGFISYVALVRSYNI